MTDAAITWYDYGGDIQIQNGDIVADNGLATAVLISLFTDSRAPNKELLPDENGSLRGWWGDFDSERETGSLLWLLNREKTIQETATRAQQYCNDALQWLVDDGVAESFSVEVIFPTNSAMQITIRITRGDANDFEYLWDAVENYSTGTVQNTSIDIEFIP